MTVAGVLDAVARGRDAILTGALVAGLCLPLGYCEGRRAGVAAERAIAARAREKAAADARAADTAAAAARVDDAAKMDAKRREIDNAIAKAAPGVPADAALALNCDRLRRAGFRVAEFPACARFAGDDGGKTRP